MFVTKFTNFSKNQITVFMRITEKCRKMVSGTTGKDEKAGDGIHFSVKISFLAPWTGASKNKKDNRKS
jgi:hypothetical protein